MGCYNLLKTVQERVRPRYHVFGHVHEGLCYFECHPIYITDHPFPLLLDYGITSDGHTFYVNAAIYNFYERSRSKPIIFDIPNKK